MSETFIRRDLPLILIFIFGVLSIVPFFYPHPTLLAIKAELGTWTVIIANVSIFLGLFYMAYSQYRTTLRERTMSAYFFFVTPFAAMVLFVFAALAFPGYTSGAQYQWLYFNIYSAQVAMYVSMPLFYCYSAAYRAFTVRSIEAFALMLGGMLYTLRMIPLFTFLIPPLHPIGEWILLVPNVAGGRGAVICVGLAAVVLGLRTLAGREVTTIEVR